MKATSAVLSQSGRVDRQDGGTAAKALQCRTQQGKVERTSRAEQEGWDGMDRWIKCSGSCGAIYLISYEKERSVSS